MKCPKCNATENLVVVKYENGYKQLVYNGNVVKEKKKSKIVCDNFNGQGDYCGCEFEAVYEYSGIKKSLVIPINFNLWSYEIVGKPFFMKKRPAINLKIFTRDGLTYFAAAIGSKAEIFLQNNFLEDYVLMAELRMDRNGQYKLFFNEDREIKEVK